MNNFVVNNFNKYVRGARFLDVGPLYGTVNETLTTAKNAGASAIAAADIDPLEAESWQKLRERCGSLGLTGFSEYSTSIDNPNARDIVGIYDFGFCAGVIYHCPISVLYSSTIAVAD